MLISEERVAELVAGAPSNAVTLINPLLGNFAILCKEDVVAAHTDDKWLEVRLRGLQNTLKYNLSDEATVVAVVCDLADRRSAKPAIWVRLQDSWTRRDQ